MCQQVDCSIYPGTTSEIDEGGKTPLKQKDSIQFGQPDQLSAKAGEEEIIMHIILYC